MLLDVTAIHARALRHVRGSARIYDVRMAHGKLSHIMGPRASQDLRSRSLIMAPDITQF